MTTALAQAPLISDSRSPLRGWSAVLAVTLGIFCLMTSELLPVGLLTPIGTELGVSDGTAGLMVTVPGLVAALFAPVLTVAAGRLDRRLVLCVLIALMATANLAAALAPGFAVVLAARVLVGVSVGGFWAIAGGLALRLVPQRHVGRATAVIFGGVSTASVLGIPAGTLLGELSGWRIAFAAVGGLGLTALVGLVVLLPPLPPQRAITFPELSGLLRGNRGVRTGVLITFFLVAGHFAAYTFVRPILQEISGVDSGRVSTLLLAFGGAGIVGNFLAGSRNTRRTLLMISLGLAATLPLIASLTGQVTAIVLLLVWGLVYGGVSVSLQTWMIKAAPQATEAASALLVAMFNLAIAVGALIGGFTADAITTGASAWLGTILALLAAATLWTIKHPVRLRPVR